jgi:hypothetical protein
MEYTPDRIEKMDKIFEYFMDFDLHKKGDADPDKFYFSQLFGISKDLAQNLINSVLKIAHELELLTAQKHGYGNFYMVNMNRINCEDFKRNGGFKQYFDHLNITRNNFSHKTINITGNNNQVNQDSRNLENFLSAQIPQATPQIQPQMNKSIRPPIRNILSETWKIISHNPLVSGIVAVIVGTIIATIILKHFGII